MSDHIDTRDGWRKVQGTEGVGKRRLLVLDEKANIEEVWVREQPLPTTPYTVIRVQWKHFVDESAPVVLTLDEGARWYGRYLTTRTEIAADQLHPRIIAFEVLAEPRAVTAKATLDRLAEVTAPENILTGGAYRQVAGEFGVSS